MLVQSVISILTRFIQSAFRMSSTLDRARPMSFFNLPKKIGLNPRVSTDNSLT